MKVCFCFSHWKLLIWSWFWTMGLSDSAYEFGSLAGIFLRWVRRIKMFAMFIDRIYRFKSCINLANYLPKIVLFIYDRMFVCRYWSFLANRTSILSGLINDCSIIFWWLAIGLVHDWHNVFISLSWTICWMLSFYYNTIILIFALVLAISIEFWIKDRVLTVHVNTELL